MSDDGNGSGLRNRLGTFTLNERKVLLKLINKYYDDIYNKRVDAKANNAKTQAWESIQEEYTKCEEVQIPRTSQQLKRCWENLRGKAKKGESDSIKLLKWADTLRRMELLNGGTITEDIYNDISSDAEYMSDAEDDASKDFKYMETPLDESLLQLTHITEPDPCQHCQCDKAERAAKLQFLKWNKQRKEHIYNLKEQFLKAQDKRSRQLHRLNVQEQTLKIENERRRAAILDREQKRQF